MIKTKIITDKATIAELEELEKLWKLNNFTMKQKERFEELVMKYKDVDSYEIIEK